MPVNWHAAIPIEKGISMIRHHLSRNVIAMSCLAIMTIANQQAWAAPNFPITNEQRQMAQVAQNGVDIQWLAENAPNSYTVQPNDTLWKISSMFLKSAWRWPALWGLNMNEIRNPHLIFPGEVLNLVVVDGKARLTRAGMSSTEIRLSPRVRIEDQINRPISTIAYEAIAPFLTKPFMVDDEQYVASAAVFASRDNRLNVGTGGTLYASGFAEDVVVGQVFSLYRPGRSIKDPQSDGGKTVLGVEAVHLGEAKLLRLDPQGTATLEVINSTQEIGKGDKLLPISREVVFQYAPHAPNEKIQGSIVMMHDGRTGSSLLSTQTQGRAYESEGGPLSIVVINQGQNDGVEPGQVFDMIRPAKTIQERSSFGFHEGNKVAPAMKVPAEKYGNMMVFKTFAKISYAIVLQASTSVLPLDEFVSAGQSLEH